MALAPVNPTGAANPNPYFLAINTLFNSAFNSPGVPLWHNKVAQVTPMTSEVEGFGWSDLGKRAREWKGARVADQPQPRTYYVAAKPYEKTTEVDMFKFMDDRYGVLQRVSQAAQMLAKEVDYQLRDLWLNLGSQTGAFQKGLDGLDHWNSAHPVNFYDAAYGTYNNDYRGAAGVGGIGGPLAMAAYTTVQYDMMVRKSANGEALGVYPNKLACGAYLQAIAKHILNATFLGLKSFYGQTDNVGSADNIMRATADLETILDLGTSLDWFMLDTGRGNMPFAVCTRELGQYAELTKPTDLPVFSEHKYVFGGYSRFVVAWGHPILSSISGPTAGV